MLRQLVEFIVAVAHHWGALVTGGFVVAVIAVYERVRKKSISGWPLWSAIIISLLVAFFLSWNDERAKVIEITGQLIRPGQEHISAVAARIHLGKSLQLLAPRKNAPPDAVQKWRADLLAWTNETAAFLSTISVQASLKFLDTSGLLSMTYDEIHPDIQNEYNVLDRRIGNLTQIIEKPETYLR